MKKILFVTPFSPCSGHAGAVYTNHLLFELSKHCEIDLVYFCYPHDKRFESTNNIRVLQCKKISFALKLLGFISFCWIFPIFTARFSWGEYLYLKKILSQKNYDFVYFDFSQTFVYSLLLNHPHKILMAHDVMAQKYSRMKTYFRYWVRQSEKKLLKSGEVFTFSDKDCEIISNLYHLSSTPTTFFLADDVKHAEPTVISDYFVFFGGWSRLENYEALKWFIQKVNPLIPDTKYKIIGSGLPNSIKILLPDNFEYLGYVENPYPLIANAIAEIAPLRKGAGVKVKCIDALGCGTPVIGTNVAFEGIPQVFKNFMLKVESPSDYANVILNINISLNERKLFKEKFIREYNDKKILNYIYQGCTNS